MARLLLVDDDEEIRVTLGLALRSEGFDVLEARNGLHALQQLMQTPLPDAILLDMTMPVMTGFEFLEYQAQDPRIRGIPVIAVTAYAKVSEIRGVRMVLRKPFDLDRLYRAVREVVPRLPG